MIRYTLVGLTVLASAAVVSPLPAQGPAPAVADSGIKFTAAVTRVSLYRFVEGKQQDVARDLTTHLIPVWEAEKQAGIISGYSTMTNVSKASPDDWDFGFAISYKNYAGLDSLGARVGPITLKHYGSDAARTAAGDARAQLRVLVSSRLVTSRTYNRP